MSFPVQWDKPHFKKPIAKKVVRGIKRAKSVSAEQLRMRAVRAEDRYCRWPLCGCRKFKLRADVCHTVHRGMGGNPKGDRTDPLIMILLCSARHKENSVSLDRGTLKIQPLTSKGLRGPCAFLVDLQTMGAKKARWLEVARETARHTFEPFKPEQRSALEQLAEMLL